jgi:SAM-dependent methyltransferase
MKDDFWEQRDVVDQFAARDPDHRLAALVEEFRDPRSVRVLDLGCAAGRNTVFLAERGFDVEALDASEAMARRTRERLGEILGPEAAARRVRVGRMDDLSAYDAGRFDLVVALGIYHNARHPDEWERAVAETARVLGANARLLVNHFTPQVDLTGEGTTAVPGIPDLYDGFPGGRVILRDAASLDAAMRRHGLEPLVPSATVTAPTEKGRRVSVNALYGKRAG